VVVVGNAWVTVVGTLGGVAVGVIGTWFLETRRWKREDQIRWDPDRRQVYARFMKAADDYSLAGSRFAKMVELMRESSRAPGLVKLLEEADLELRRAADVLRPEEWEIELVGGSDVRTAAARVIALATTQREAEINESSIGRVDSTAVERAEQAAEETRAAIEEFKRAARAEIGLGQ
jgi:hypothetical protein